MNRNEPIELFYCRKIEFFHSIVATPAFACNIFIVLWYNIVDVLWSRHLHSRFVMCWVVVHFSWERKIKFKIRQVYSSICFAYELTKMGSNAIFRCALDWGILLRTLFHSENAYRVYFPLSFNSSKFVHFIRLLNCVYQFWRALQHTKLDFWLQF